MAKDKAGKSGKANQSSDSAKALGWRQFRSDKGRLWATRERPFTEREEEGDAQRTVDADDPRELTRKIAEQEGRAMRSRQPPDAS